MSVFIANETGESDVDEVTLAGLARFVLDAMKVNPLAELSIMIVETAAMTDLHVRYMGEDGPTDVLAFPQDEAFESSYADSADNDPATLLGDVVLCPEVARKQAVTAGHTAQRELHLLCTHGILHLLGYDHAEQAEEREMFRLQEDLLTRWEAAVALEAGAGSAGAGGAGSGSAGAVAGPASAG
ncbi:rRNA maturation RNase YbeY [Frankia sp. AgB1.9]|uniref:rRNA maturation RNase YbeY n=1 Tax=unclassified Frankia TaxID=2632575 RepID=UPI00193302EA|nr:MULTISPECIES: rRNA maturation RNase YbeY [unclassified Frankia]MBL7486995.1 rRNA maturation RNase YbeY [Frankia sp. AgW1.1]MBL7552021.1 rRNA maturation RNase YbeY [Frankia sp. AgB1.9]MBL7623340.1 rRNA maturation RNase YbeY [Frankia sp. AgB1.8]